MKKQIIISLCFLVFGIFNSTSQSYFANQDELINYLEGDWKLDAISIWGNIDTLPCQLVGDSCSHNFQFIITNNDSLPLLCKSFVNDSLYEERMVEIEFETNSGWPGFWRLINLSQFLPYRAAILEDGSSIYELSEDSMTLFQMVFDGAELGLSRMSTSSEHFFSIKSHIIVYPNPMLNNRLCFDFDEINMSRHFSIEIYNTYGILMDRIKKIDNINCYDVHSLSTGIYFIVINTEDRKYTSKIIKI